MYLQLHRSIIHTLGSYISLGRDPVFGPGKNSTSKSKFSYIYESSLSLYLRLARQATNYFPNKNVPRTNITNPFPKLMTFISFYLKLKTT